MAAEAAAKQARRNISTLPEIERKIADLDYEEGVAWDREGKFITHRFGEREITYLDHEIERMGGGTLTHNHPSGEPPAPRDYQFAIRAGLAQMRVVTKNGVWVIRPPEGGWPGATMDARMEYWLSKAPEIRRELAAYPPGDRPLALVDLIRQHLGAEVVLH